MNYHEITYRENTSTEEEIIEHFRRCANSFNPPLNTYVVIAEYARKILIHAINFEAWDRKLLVGLSSVYFNNLTDKNAYWTNLSVLDDYRSEGIALRLASSVIDYGIKNGFKKIDLEVRKINLRMIKFHKLNGAFVCSENKDSLLMTYLLDKMKK